MVEPGQRLRLLREQLGLTVRDVEAASTRLATKHKNSAFSIPRTRVSDIELNGVVPSIYRLYSLSIIYRKDLHDLLALYEIHLDGAAQDLCLAPLVKTHLVECLRNTRKVEVPLSSDSEFDLSCTQNLGRLVKAWGAVPFTFLTQMANAEFSYGYIGAEDLTMYPLLLPGTFVQIDESKHEVSEGSWHSERDRPIYFLESRTGYECGWCQVQGDQLILQPHPLSGQPVKVFRFQQDIDVVGQVVGIAMQIGRR